MKPKLIIHAGIQRTGTTTIQRALAGNRAELLKRGICYPGDRPHHQRWMWDFRSGKISAAELSSLLIATKDEADTVIVSAEDFCRLQNLSWLEAVRPHFQTEAYIVLRRQDDWLMSWYDVNVRWPFNAAVSKMAPDEFLGTLDTYHWLDYADLLDRWVAAVDRVHVRTLGGDQLTDFAETFGLGRLEVGNRRINDSSSPEVLAVLRHIGLSDMGAPKRTKVIEAAKNAVGAVPKTFIYPVETRAEILARFAASNAAVASRYFGRDELFPPIDGAAVASSYTIEEAIAAMGRVVRALV